MSETFATYDMERVRSNPTEVYDLSDGLLPEIAQTAGYELAPEPTEANLSGLIAAVGPAKELQANIQTVKDRFGADATQKIADWIDRSEIMAPVERPFGKNTPISGKIDAIVFSGGVANWMLRRTAVTEQIDADKVGSVVLPMGNREMKPVEHALVREFARVEGRFPTEAEFGQRYLLGRLAAAGFRAEVVPVDSGNGDQVLDALWVAKPELSNGTMLVAANAPNAVQAAGQVRLSARRADAAFDKAFDQLYMASDSFPIARHGEKPKTHQNPETALGQLVRNALFIHKNS